MRIPSMSQNVPTRPGDDLESTPDLDGGLSETVAADARPGTLDVLCITAPYETYDRMNLYQPIDR